MTDVPQHPPAVIAASHEYDGPEQTRRTRPQPALYQNHGGNSVIQVGSIIRYTTSVDLVGRVQQIAGMKEYDRATTAGEIYDRRRWRGRVTNLNSTSVLELQI